MYNYIFSSTSAGGGASSEYPEEWTCWHHYSGAEGQAAKGLTSH